MDAESNRVLARIVARLTSPTPETPTQRKQCPACLRSHNGPAELCPEDERLAQQLEHLKAIAILATCAVLTLLAAVVLG